MIDLPTFVTAVGATAIVGYGAWLGGMAISAHTRLTKLEDKQKAGPEDVK